MQCWIGEKTRSILESCLLQVGVLDAVFSARWKLGTVSVSRGEKEINWRGEGHRKEEKIVYFTVLFKVHLVNKKSCWNGLNKAAVKSYLKKQ